MTMIRVSSPWCLAVLVLVPACGGDSFSSEDPVLDGGGSPDTAVSKDATPEATIDASPDCGSATLLPDGACRQFDYTWTSGEWSECSAACDGGMQTRDVWCQRDDGEEVDASYCEELAPEVTQACNEDACCTTNLPMQSGKKCTGGTNDISDFHWVQKYKSNTGSVADREACAAYCTKHAESDGLSEWCCDLAEDWTSSSINYICALHTTPQLQSWSHEDSEASYALTWKVR